MSGSVEELRGVKAEADQIAYFSNIAETQRWVRDPAYESVGCFTRIPRTDGENDLLAITLRTPSTIPNWLMLLRSQAFDTKDDYGSRSQPDLLFMVDLQRGINGFKDTGHGGVLTTLLDEGLSFCGELYQRAHLPKSGSMMYTANLNIDFRAPFITPGIGLIKVWMTKVEGRKYWLSGVLEDKEGTVTTEAKALCITARPGKI